MRSSVVVAGSAATIGCAFDFDLAREAGNYQAGPRRPR